MRRIDIGEQVRVAAGAHRAEPRGFSGRVIAKRGDRVQVSTGSYGGQDHGVWVDIADVTQGPSGNPTGHPARVSGSEREDIKDIALTAFIYMKANTEVPLGKAGNRYERLLEDVANEIAVELVRKGYVRTK